MAPDRLLPLRIRTSRGPRRGRAVDGEGGRYGPPAFAGLVPLAQTTVYDSRLVASVCQDADALGVPVDLHVLKVNPAIRLYQRLGFVLTGETATHYTLRHEPPRAA